MCAPAREFVIDNLLVPIHLIIVMIRQTGLAPWEFEFPFPGSLTTTFLSCTPGTAGPQGFCDTQGGPNTEDTYWLDIVAIGLVD